MRAAACAVLLALAGRVPADADSATAPFAVEAGAGPQAGARVDARVTRVVDGVRVSLPGAVVPALEPGDVVDVRFPDYTRPAARANYHVNVAFITEAAPQRWLYERSGPWDRLFAEPPRARKGRQPAPEPLAPGLHFTYGAGDARGIPIFFIVPEDGKTRGMDGVRDYVDAHPTNFKNMAQSANDAAERYVWFTDFLSSLANGSLDPVSARQRVETVAASLGANPAAIDTCYSLGGTSGVVADCIKSQLNAVNYQTNISAPTQAQFFGGAVGAAAPVQIASYLVPLLSVWKVFVYTGHREFEYLPTTLMTAATAAGSTPGRQLLMGLKVPSLRPPAAYSDALFFTIGDPQAAAAPPVAVNTADPNGACVAGARLNLPLHLDRTSAFVHDTGVVVTPDGAPAYVLPVDPRSIDAPTIDASALKGAADGGYSLALTGRFGFDPIRRPAQTTARIVVPQASAAWSIAPMPHRPAIAGEAIDLVAASAAAPCLTRAELQIGNEPPLPLDVRRLSDRRIALHAPAPNLPPGEARVRLYQTDAVHDTEIENDVAVAIESRPARVDTAAAPVAHAGDRSIFVTGSGLDASTGLRFNGTLYTKDADSTATAACFSGPPIAAAGLVPGQLLSTQLVERGGAGGQVFVTRFAAPRPVLRPPTASPDAPLHFSTQPLTVGVSAAGDLPVRREVLLRRAAVDATPCAGTGDPSAVTIPAGAQYERTPASLSLQLDAAALLGDRAFGQLQIALVDTASASTSDWVTLPGAFVRAPRVSRIQCATEAAPACMLIGTGLDAVDAIEDGAGASTPPNRDCVTTEKGMACVGVPHQSTYVLRLHDEHAAFAVPSTLVTIGPPAIPSTAPPASAPPVSPSAASSTSPARASP